MKMMLAVVASLLLILPFQAKAESCIDKDVDVWVASGHGLTGDGLLNPDPYVVVKIGPVKKQTKVIYSNDNPTWWEKLTFPEASSDMMTVEVWDKDSITADDKVGTCTEQLVASQSFQSVECKMNSGRSFVKLFYKCT
ncbi:uncharacterized protein LOC126394618 [Epinephelus moara]|uniref:uncharacterized protein LOC126394618 n=1 Tax=Epinephelus moara TaxID=300413 RepID=UPI00214E721D|nr:uncharacterized protein LOC126394618 [Epinephelus moara]